MTADPPDTAERLASFAVASVPGNEQEALDLVARSVAGLIAPARLDRLKTAVAEATANAIEHGHGGRPDLAVDIEVYRLGEQVVVTIADQGPAQNARSGGNGGNGDRPEDQAEVPDLARKLAGEQAPRGWGLFIIRHMVDAMDVVTRDGRHIVRLAMRAGGD
ncbi:MAG: ATP-binding protein [Streptosporangiaceae bacterium]